MHVSIWLYAARALALGLFFAIGDRRVGGVFSVGFPSVLAHRGEPLKKIKAPLPWGRGQQGAAPGVLLAVGRALGRVHARPQGRVEGPEQDATLVLAVGRSLGRLSVCQREG